MNLIFERCRKFFTDIFEKIGIFFKKIVEEINDFRIFLCSEIKKNFEKIKLKKEEFLKNQAIKKNEKKAAKLAKKEEKLKAKQEREQRRQEEAVQRNIYLKTARTRIFRGFLNIFDVIFEVIFACGLIFCIRPELLDFENKTSYFKEFNFDSSKLILFENFLLEPDEISDLTIFIIVCIFAAYLLYKIIFSLFTANGVNKLISILLTVITLISVTLIKDKLLIFLVLYILLFATFQFSCGFDFKVIKIKFIAFICLAFVSYIVVLYIFDDLFKNFAIQLFKEMKMPVKWL